MENLLDFLLEYGFKVLGAIVSIITYIVAWKSGKKSGSSSLLNDLKKLEKIEKKYNKSEEIKK